MFVTTSLLNVCMCTQIRETVSRSLTSPVVGSWIRTFAFQTLSYVLVADHPHSDSHQFGRDCFFRMTVLFSFCCKINNLKIAGVTASNIYFQVPRSVEVPWLCWLGWTWLGQDGGQAGLWSGFGYIPPVIWSCGCLEYALLMAGHRSTKRQAETVWYILRPQLGAVTLSLPPHSTN